jgi:hypothetical protein
VGSADLDALVPVDLEPAQRIEQLLVALLAVTRGIGVSMRKTSVPPLWRAYAQLNSTVRISPTCGRPVGEGQKRTRTSAPEAVVVRGSGVDIRIQLSSRMPAHPVWAPALSEHPGQRREGDAHRGNALGTVGRDDVERARLACGRARDHPGHERNDSTAIRGRVATPMPCATSPSTATKLSVSNPIRGSNPRAAQFEQVPRHRGHRRSSSPPRARRRRRVSPQRRVASGSTAADHRADRAHGESAGARAVRIVAVAR